MELSQLRNLSTLIPEFSTITLEDVCCLLLICREDWFKKALSEELQRRKLANGK